MTMFDKIQILQRLLESPTANEKEVFIRSSRCALGVRIKAAKGLQAMRPSGLELMVKETEERLLKDTGSKVAR